MKRLLYSMILACISITLVAQSGGDLQKIDVKPILDIIALSDIAQDLRDSQHRIVNWEDGTEDGTIDTDSNTENEEANQGEDIDNDTDNDGISAPIEPLILQYGINGPTENSSGDALRVKLYPNPTKDVLNIDFGARDNYEVIVYNMLGSIQTQFLVTDVNDYQINVSDLQEGFYLLQFSNGETVVTQRLTVVK